MANEYIEVVKRWRAGEAISLEELRANAEAAYAASAAVDAVDATYAYAAWAAYAAAVDAASAASDADARAADHWVKRYEELTNGK